jgi:ubiquinone/menaquinone biosynthesis C-methylase UbiE
MPSSENLFTDGAAYERLMGRWSKLVGREFLDWLAPPPSLRWIDIGCGTGAFTAELIDRCSPREVLGVDPAEDQLAFARSRPELRSAQFRVGDAQGLPCADDAFDMAVMALVIHFVPDPPKAIEEMARVLEPGGSGASYVWDYSIRGSPTAPLFSALKSIGRAAAGPPSPHATAFPALHELWAAAGFRDLDTRVISIPVTFVSFDEFWTAMTAPVGPAGKAIAQLDAADLDRLRSALKEQVPARPDGSVQFEATANAIKGSAP